MKRKEMNVAQVIRSFPYISLRAKTKIQIAPVRTADEAQTRNRNLPNINLEH